MQQHFLLQGQQRTMSIVTKVSEEDLPSDVNHVSRQTMAKAVNKIVSISGLSGSDGYSSSRGWTGTCGKSSSDYGKTGGNGSYGTSGSSGQSGRSGTNSQHALIDLYGTVEKLDIQLEKFTALHPLLERSAGMNSNLVHPSEVVKYSFQLEESNEVILVRAVGGNGGNGGQGGDGGIGGNGGQGGPGRNGKRGRDIYSKDDSADSGNDGEDGASGGDGGNGGNGGNGGHGGDAGSGGHVKVRSTNACLFMLIEVDCQAGLQGKGGCGGKGGSGGVCGAGGAGGRGGRGGQNSAHSFGAYNGSNGAQGSTGTCGSDGKSGKDGIDGVDGNVASCGSIQYIVIDTDDNVIEKGPTKYHANVIGYTITDENNDEIYEPNSDFFITDVKWTNNGSITLPRGSILSFSSTNYISTDVNDVSLLPRATVAQTIIDSHKFGCHLNGVSNPSINRPYIHPVTITSEINLLNRLFSNSQFSTTLTCQYPIQITNVQIPTCLGVGERSIITITFANISTRQYGTCPDSAGSIEFIFSGHPLIKVIPVNEEFSYQVKNDEKGYYKINETIPPKSTKRISFEFSLNADAIHQLYESLPWNVVLLLRDIPIQKHENNIRVVSSFRPNIHTDVLLVTSLELDRAEFLAYMDLFRLFNYSSQIWDIQRYEAFHHPEVNWLNTTDLIIFIYSNPRSTFSAIKSQLFLQHMNSSDNAGFICVDAPTSDHFDFALFDYNNLQFIDNEQKNQATPTNHLWSGSGHKQLNENELNMMANKSRIDYEKQEDHKFLYQVVYTTAKDIRFQQSKTVVHLEKYVYKSNLDSDIGSRLIMIPKDNHLLTNQHLPSKLKAEAIIPGFIQNEIDLNSRFGRLISAILLYQGFEKSYRIINEQWPLSNFIFKSHSIKLNFNQILVSIAMSIIEREYDRASLNFPLSNRLTKEIANIIKDKNNTMNGQKVYTNGWFYLLIQSLYEYIDSKFWKSFPWYGHNDKAKQRHKLQEIMNDLYSLSAVKISKNKEVYPLVRVLRLQRLANLQCPAADTRENCARPIREIQAWKEEQKINDTRLPTGQNFSSV